MIALLLQLFLARSQTPQQPASDPSVLIVVLDDVGYDDLAECVALGGAPTLTELAARGRTYTSAYADPLCSPTRWCLNFGRWHAGPLIPTCSDSGLEPPGNLTSLAELRLGRQCGFFGKWHLGEDPYGTLPWTYAPLEHGWDFWGEGTPANVAECGGTGYTSWLRVQGGQVSVSAEYEPQAVASSCANWMALAGGSWLACVNANLAHSPAHQPPAALIPASFSQPAGTRGTYLAMVAAYDALIGQILGGVDPLTTLVMVIGDNGTPGWAVGGGLQQGGGKGSIYEAGIHVPLIVAGPGVPKGATSSALVHAVDIHATVADAWNVAGTGDGISLLRSGSHDYVLCGDSHDVCARSAGYKLTRNRDTGVERFWVEPNESTNRILDPALAVLVDAHRAWLDAHL